MGASPSHPSCQGGRVTLIGKTHPCDAGLQQPVHLQLPCSPQEYQTILSVAQRLGEGSHCQSMSKPPLGDEVCAQLTVGIPTLAFSMRTTWVEDCSGKYWEYALTFQPRMMQQPMMTQQPMMMHPQQQVMLVKCPPTGGPGSMLQVTTPQGASVEVVVPVGVQPGAEFQVAVPAAQPAPPQQLHAAAVPTMQVAVPPGTLPGSTLQVTGPDGCVLQVAVPAGVGPGQSFTFAVPASTNMEQP